MSNEYELAADSVILSTADMQGNIVAYNKTLLEVSGYSESEIKGKPHSILRCPDMPKAVFQDLWQTISSGRPWFGVVKNKRKNGDHYWVAVNVNPVFEAGQIKSYVSVSYPASHDQKKAAAQVYAQLSRGTVKVSLTPIRQLDKVGLLALAVGLCGLVLPHYTSLLTDPVLGPMMMFSGFGLLALRGFVLSRPSHMQLQAIHELGEGAFRQHRFRVMVRGQYS
jgi:PAS domain S-box-containing protein